ncbi:MAG TPA: dihydroorotase [Phycisphaerae bacterium]|jgi:dihydroorotase|nr:dihydroorotase [Phycisphaerae bacterium]HOB74964.1 dihydroorotase [Phycisphaerae bacterium]HOJ55755.1 dihydroorotase [Phycisphaerae bacterium]HOL25759.1 dihydroorotase [Phycisphaerae bacterium]HPP19548.1 dihydroorotase [Phycisphaerae bacterium]
MADGKLLIKGGRVIDPAAGVDRTADVLLADGKVAGIDSSLSVPDAQVIDARGRIVCPGLIDIHVHFREPGDEDEETIATGSAAAVAGGFTSVACMPNTRPALDDEAGIEFVYHQARRADLCNVYPVGAITKNREGAELAEMGQMIRAGAVGFSDDGTGVARTGLMLRALQYVKMFDTPILQHCEDPDMAAGGVMNSGVTAVRLGLPGMNPIAEELMIQRDLTLVRATGSRYHVAHISTARGVELVRQAKAAGLPVTCEVCPHHLLLTEEACATYDTNYKMSPPLRTRADVEACLQGVVDGTIDCLVTDHAPHGVQEKEREFLDAPFGIIGLECALPLYVKAFIETGLMDWPGIIERLTIRPARVLSLEKGTLATGADADVTIIDPNLRWTIDVRQFKSKSRNCPYHGWDVTGRATHTIVGGKIKYQLNP